MTRVIIAAEHTANSGRGLFDTDWPLDDRLTDFIAILEGTGTPALSTHHQIHAVSGPDHEHFSAALAAYGLTHYVPLDEQIVDRTMQLLVAAEILPPAQFDDNALRVMIATGFSCESDWDDRGKASSAIARTYLHARYEGFTLELDGLDRERFGTYAAMTGGIAVAVTQARAEWRA